MKYKGEDFNELKRRRLGAAFSLSEDTTFTFHDLNVKTDITCSTYTTNRNFNSYSRK
ncbi:hypothetical protein [Mammaliicoccus sp. A-M2]|uniref:hypothetical protein n=1 Tax=Mammaliicoccus sp. A-M2 TaxID=2898662 RepID=UPI001EFBE24A|nr:hypothetical protein [Mammaliicoccus sp. A-M2]